MNVNYLRDEPLSYFVYLYSLFQIVHTAHAQSWYICMPYASDSEVWHRLSPLRTGRQME